MAIPTRLIKRRIKSIRSTGKIMKAMELVAASKMRKTTQLAVATRPYSGALKELADRVRKLADPLQHPYLMGTVTDRRVLSPAILIVAASDRGLCGGFNNQLVRKALDFLKTRAEKIRIITVGRRAEAVVRSGGYELAASFESISNAPSFERTHPVAQLAAQEFLAGSSPRVFLCYTRFQSALVQIPTIEQVLPVVPEAEVTQARGNAVTRDDGFFEPDPDAVLAALLPRLVEMQIYQALLESSASEHSARMLAMKSAGDAASEMLEDLTFILNQARQASITREISEISAGKAAIE